MCWTPLTAALRLIVIRKKHCNIINVKQRLNLMYGKRAGLKLYNRPEGVYSEIILPLILEQEESTC